MRRLRLITLVAHSALLHAWAIMIAFYLSGWKAAVVTASLPVASWMGFDLAICSRQSLSASVLLCRGVLARVLGLVLVAERAARSR